MIITKLALPRRTFLRGMGVSLALPLLDAMVPALTAATKPIPRMGFSYCGNGAVMHNSSASSTKTPVWGNPPPSPHPREVTPRVIFERLFGEGGTAAQRMARLGEDRSLLDFVNSDINRLQNKLGNGDRRRVAEYLD